MGKALLTFYLSLYLKFIINLFVVKIYHGISYIMQSVIWSSFLHYLFFIDNLMVFCSFIFNLNIFSTLLCCMWLFSYLRLERIVFSFVTLGKESQPQVLNQGSILSQYCFHFGVPASVLYLPRSAALSFSH